ncbi:hypothetical protein J6590_020904 [Homalodisca vitripennis]|nr:hypothetical protein J6590_020904 [Homalodisca vitripennis]
MPQVFFPTPAPSEGRLSGKETILNTYEPPTGAEIDFGSSDLEELHICFSALQGPEVIDFLPKQTFKTDTCKYSIGRDNKGSNTDKNIARK